MISRHCTRPVASFLMAFAFFSLLSGELLPGQTVARGRAVDPRVSYHRIICVVPYIGKGTLEDPRRPMYVPTAGAKIDRAGIIAYSHLPSDDKSMAIVEFVAIDAKAFAPLLADKSVKVFIRGKDSKETIDGEMKRWSKDLDLDKFHAVVR